MTHISSELINDKTLSMWLATIAVLAFAAGYGMASIRHASTAQVSNGSAQARNTDLAMGKYGHLSQRP